MTRKGLAGVLITTLLSAPLHAEMNVAAFLVKANALKAMGPFAITSPDLDILKKELLTVNRAYEAMLKKDKAAGRTPHSCPPQQVQSRITPDMILTHINSIPAPLRRKTSVRTAMFAMMKKRYPCP